MSHLIDQSYIHSCHRKLKVRNTPLTASYYRNASNNFGPALNKHLPIVLQLVKRKQDLASTERIHELKEILLRNGGTEAEKIVRDAGLK
jgi:hypothetical protein